MLSPRKMKTMEIINIDWLKIILQEPLFFFLVQNAVHICQNSCIMGVGFWMDTWQTQT